MTESQREAQKRYYQSEGYKERVSQSKWSRNKGTAYLLFTDEEFDQLKEEFGACRADMFYRYHKEQLTYQQLADEQEETCFEKKLTKWNVAYRMRIMNKWMKELIDQNEQKK